MTSQPASAHNETDEQIARKAAREIADGIVSAPFEPFWKDAPRKHPYLGNWLAVKIEVRFLAAIREARSAIDQNFKLAREQGLEQGVTERRELERKIEAATARIKARDEYITYLRTLIEWAYPDKSQQGQELRAAIVAADREAIQGGGAPAQGLTMVRDCWNCFGATAWSVSCQHCGAKNPWGQEAREPDAYFAHREKNTRPSKPQPPTPNHGRTRR